APWPARGHAWTTATPPGWGTAPAGCTGPARLVLWALPTDRAKTSFPRPGLAPTGWSAARLRRMGRRGVRGRTVSGPPRASWLTHDPGLTRWARRAGSVRGGGRGRMAAGRHPRFSTRFPADWGRSRRPR